MHKYNNSVILLIISDYNFSFILHQATGLSEYTVSGGALLNLKEYN
jgi:hypothetical protein